MGSQRFSLTTAILLATLTGAATYALGAQGARPAAPALGYKEPTQASFDAALKELQTWIPEDCLATDRDSLTSHGHSEWAGEWGPTPTSTFADKIDYSSRPEWTSWSCTLPSQHR